MGNTALIRTIAGTLLALGANFNQARRIQSAPQELDLSICSSTSNDNEKLPDTEASMRRAHTYVQVNFLTSQPGAAVDATAPGFNWFN